MDGVMLADRIYRNALEWSNEAFIQAMWAAHPERMIAAGARAPDSRPVRRLKKKSFAHEEWQPSASVGEILSPEFFYVPPSYVMRDPCPMCGVRGDIGCKHRRNVA